MSVTSLCVNTCVNTCLNHFIIKMGKLFPVLSKVPLAGGKFMVEISFLEHFPLPLLQSNSYSFTSHSKIWANDIFSILYTVKIKTSLEHYTIPIYHNINSKLKTVNWPCKHSFNMYAFFFPAPSSKQTITSRSVLDTNPGPPMHVAFNHQGNGSD